MKNIPVILVGGIGKRLWPLSNSKTPKQFLKFNSRYSLFQKTLIRLKKIKLSKPIIVCNKKYKKIILQEVKKIGIKANFIFEPISKNTAPAAITSSIYCDPEDNLIILPSDHFFQDNSDFVKKIKKGLNSCSKDRFITFGVKPTFPNTEYGYIEVKEDKNEILEVSKYIEKPNSNIAKNFVSSGKHFWNSGIFIGKARLFIDEIQKFKPKIFENCKAAVNSGIRNGNILYIDLKFYKSCENISIDNAIMEKTKNISMILFNSEWNDLGSWNSIWEISKKDNKNNVSPANVLTICSENSFFYSKSKSIVSVGNRDLIVVENNNNLLIINKNYLHKMKNIYSSLKNK